jgi:hypothetical protein
MALKRGRVLAAGLWLISACGDDGEEAPSSNLGDAGAMTPTVNAQPEGGADLTNPTPAMASVGDGSLPPVAGDAGVNARDASTSPNDAGKVEGDAAPPVTPQAYDYMMQEVALTTDLVIPKGKTLRVGPGVKFSAKSKIKVDVQGTLVVEGSASAATSFMGDGQPESWQGIVVASGGSLTLTHVQIGNAQYGLHALPGSSFAVDHALFDTSFKGAVLQANGTIAHAVFKAELLFPAVTDEVAIDDPNGYLTIIDASPTITNSRFDGSGGLNDMVRIGGMASPTFDHCFVNNSHCGFHTNGGSNTSARITNTIFENLSYGVMAYSTKPIIESSVFRRNSNDVGMCSGATPANTPVLTSNFYEGGAVKLDASCDKIGTKDSSAASSANASAGPSGL